MDELTVRDCLERDLPFIEAIYRHYVHTSTATFEIDPPDVAELARRRLAAMAGGGVYLVGECAGEVVGYAYAGPYRPRAAYAHTLENSVYLRQDMGGRGIGRQLLLALIAACEAKGVAELIAVVGGGMENQASISLHRKLGFRDVGTLERVGFKFGRWLDTHLMQRSLRTSAPAFQSIAGLPDDH